MYNYTVSTIIGFVAMVFAMSSYFVKKKSVFLIAQAGAILSLAFSCLFIVQYYAVVSYVLGLIRVGVFYLYERKGKSAPNWLIATFVGLYMLFYVIVNIVILQTFNALDILLLIANVFFTVAFSIRNLTLVRYIFLLPLAISVVYYVLIPGGSLFVIISYSFELLANAVAILYNSKFVYMYVKKIKDRQSSKNK
jgi:hypothetical protein